MREEIYNCMPWVGVQKAGIGFRQPKGAAEDDRYLSVWIMIDQDEDARFSALPAERRASAMFSRYGTDLLRRMAALQPLVADPNVQGFSVVLSWLKPGTGGAVQPVNETLALFVDKPTTLGFLGKRVSAGEFTRRAKFSVFDGVQDMGRLPLEVWEDSFVRTFKVANYEAAQGPEVLGLTPDRSPDPLTNQTARKHPMRRRVKQAGSFRAVVKYTGRRSPARYHTGSAAGRNSLTRAVPCTVTAPSSTITQAPSSSPSTGLALTTWYSRIRSSRVSL